MKVIKKEDLAKIIKDGATIGLGGFGGSCAPDELMEGLQDSYSLTGHPAGLTVFTGVCTGDNGFSNQGCNRLTADGLIDTIIAGHFKNSRLMDRIVTENKVAAYTLPLGCVMHILRATAGGESGYVTKIGLNTYADPRVEGCAVNKRAKDQGKKLVSVVNIDGKDLLYYRSIPLDVCLIRATFADEAGNISNVHEGIRESLLDYALAAHNHGGIVVVQVEQVLQNGSIPPLDVVLNHTIVDYVVVSKPENHRQNFGVDRYHPELVGEYRIPVEKIEPIPLSIQKIIARRAVMELRPGIVINVGIGMPSAIGNIGNEEGIMSDITLSLETGPIGGVPKEGACFGSCINPESLYTVSDTFDYYNGGGLDMTFLGLAQVDASGNVNVSKFGPSSAGPGGFINITQNTPKVCFIGSFMAQKANVKIHDGKLEIIEEGRGEKFVSQVDQITFSAKTALKNGQKVYYITERAVFRLTSQGLELTEIAPGMDLEKDVLAHMKFLPLISKNLKRMDSRLYREEKMGLTEDSK